MMKLDDYTTAEISELTRKCCVLVGSEFGRIITTNERMFFIVRREYNCNYKYILNGKIECENFYESVVASGKTSEELIKSVEDFVRLCNISWDDFFNEMIIGK